MFHFKEGASKKVFLDFASGYLVAEDAKNGDKPGLPDFSLFNKPKRG
jgi:hypothetical protein